MYEYSKCLWDYIMMKMMKSQNIICFVFALILLMAMPAAAVYTPPGGSGGGILELGDDPATTLSITAPDEVTGWVLRPGVNSRVGLLKVSANGNWQVTANDNDTTTNGQMTEWYDGSYINNPKQLASTMSVSVESGGNISSGYEVELPVGGMIANGGNTTGEKNVEVTFKQPVSLNDEVLIDGHRYKIVVYLTISPFS
jgi:hypothetical protein